MKLIKEQVNKVPEIVDCGLSAGQVADYFTAPMYEGDFVVLGQLLVRYHNSITKENSSLYGAKMDKALCRDTFGTLYRRGPSKALEAMEGKFNERGAHGTEPNENQSERPPT